MNRSVRMSFDIQSLVLMMTLNITASNRGPIIELPSDYNRTSPWTQLAALGTSDLTETDCQRTCTEDELPRVCIHTFVLEYYSTMSAACGNCSEGVLEDCYKSQCIPADGYERGVTSTNRMIPGPTIEACHNDLLVVNIINKMEGASTTIHWHGILQKFSQWMDGVPYVTQCPIGSGSFRYIMSLVEVGTFFWHSHMGLQRPNGIYGPLIVRKPRSAEFWPDSIYDDDLPEHIMVISDWMHYTAEMFFPGLPTLPPGITPASLLINGVGRYLNQSDDEDSFQQSHPLTIFHVKRNHRYRFRIINANSLICPILIQIEDHNMTLITSDGEPLEPVVIDGLISYAGERYDFVIDTNQTQQGKNAFWIHFRGLGTCESAYKLDQYAVLSYDTEVGDLGIIPTGRRPTMADPLPIGTIVNHPNTTCGESPHRLCISDLRSVGRGDNIEIVTAEPDVRLFIPFDFHQYTNLESFFQQGNHQKYMTLGARAGLRSGMMNNISFMFPSTPSLLLRDAADPGFCNLDNLPAECQSDDVNSKTLYCECSHFVTIEENQIVEMTLIDASSGISGVNHPIHLHGFDFYPMCMGQDLTELETCGDRRSEEIRRQLEDDAVDPSSLMPPSKDTISVPSAGFVTIRFKADNPGDWIMHCHFEWHALVGMMMAFRVKGEIAPRPPGFPICGNFDPLLQQQDEYNESYRRRK